MWKDDLERISAVILFEEVMLDCEWISCCEEEDEVAVSATVNEACRGISGETGIETRGNEILYDASDLFCIFLFWVAYCRQTELVFLFCSALRSSSSFSAAAARGASQSPTMHTHHP